MGENAKYLGQSVKIGTCEDMYYLRAEHRHLVQHEPNSVNIASDDAIGCRFRFPWPDEDATARPGFDDDAHNFERSVHVPGLMPTTEFVHDTVQFVATSPGYVVSLPCPEGHPGATSGMSTKVDGLTVHRNGFNGSVHLCQQKLLEDGRLVPVLRCGGCGRKYRLEEAKDIEPLLVALRAEGDRTGDAWWQTVADRVALGARLEPALVEG